MKNYLIICLTITFNLLVFNLSANFNVYEFKDQQQQDRFDNLITELRCPKCQNNNLSDSNAPLATDIKNYIYKSVTDNKTKEEIVEFLKSRYGEFITYKPSFKGASLLVWTLPFIILFIALAILVFIMKSKKRKQTVIEPLQSMQSIIDDYESNNHSDEVIK